MSATEADGGSELYFPEVYERYGRHDRSKRIHRRKLSPELSAKRLELLKQVVPHASRVAVLWDPDYSDFLTDWRALRTAASALG